jgi:hypothetical protein
VSDTQTFDKWINGEEPYFPPHDLHYKMAKAAWDTAWAESRKAALEEAREIVNSIDVDPVGMDSNGGITNAQDTWLKGSMDTLDAIADAIGERI